MDNEISVKRYHYNRAFRMRSLFGRLGVKVEVHKAMYSYLILSYLNCSYTQVQSECMLNEFIQSHTPINHVATA